MTHPMVRWDSLMGPGKPALRTVRSTWFFHTGRRGHSAEGCFLHCGVRQCVCVHVCVCVGCARVSQDGQKGLYVCTLPWVSPRRKCPHFSLKEVRTHTPKVAA